MCAGGAFRVAMAVRQEHLLVVTVVLLAAATWLAESPTLHHETRRERSAAEAFAEGASARTSAGKAVLSTLVPSPPPPPPPPPGPPPPAAVDAAAATDGCPWATGETAVNCAGAADGVLRMLGDGGTAGPYAALLPRVQAGAHAATLARNASSGDVLLAWFSGDEGKAGVVVAYSRLRSGAGRWDAPQVVSQHHGRSNQNPVLFVSPDGAEGWLWHTSQAGGRGQGTSMIAALRNVGGAWGKPAWHPAFAGRDGPFLRAPPVWGGTAGSPELLLPMYYTPSRGGMAAHHCAMWRSRDGGATFGEEAVMASPGEWLAQPAVVRLANGTLRAFFRDRAGKWIYVKDSHDDGRTWPARATRTRLPNNQSGIAALVLRSGRLLIAFNNLHCVRDHCGRNPLTLALSEDGGGTWPWVRDVEGGGRRDPVPPPRQPPRLHRYAYPALLQDPQTGLVHVAYSYRKRLIKHVVVDEAWVRHGGTQGIFRGEEHGRDAVAAKDAHAARHRHERGHHAHGHRSP